MWLIWWIEDFPGGSDGKESTCNAENLGLIPGSGRYPERGHGYPLQYSCLENSMDRGAWWATVHGVTKSWTWLSNCAHTQHIVDSGAGGVMCWLAHKRWNTSVAVHVTFSMKVKWWNTRMGRYSSESTELLYILKDSFKIK